MKSIVRRTAALVLCAGLLCSTALASDALGSRLYSYTLDICDNTTLTKEVMWSASRSDLRTENYVTYTPSASVSPRVSFGSSVLAKQTVSSMAKDLEKGGDRVLSGINGDYFVMATGDPLGLVVTDGVLRSSASYLSALGFRADGTAVIGKPDLTLRADFKGYSLKIADINKIRSADGYYLFTDDFGANTKNTKKGIDVILTPVTGNDGQSVTGADGTTSLTTSSQLGIGRMVSCTVDQVVEATGATAIPDGKFVLSIASTGGEWLQEMLRSLQPGDNINLEVFSADTRWNEVDCAVGAMHWVLSGGTVASGLDNASAAPRTAVGVKSDGSVIFYTIDGRQSGLSVGATLRMVAQRLAELGCTDAVLLDGGGSTTMVSTYPDYTSSTVINSPSEGVQRSVTNAVFLVSNLNPTGTPGSLYVTPTSLTLLAGGSTKCTAACVDTGWYPMKDLPGEVTWSAEEGTVSADGTFTAPDKTGVYSVSAASGGVSGSTKIQVYDTPDAINVTDASTKKNVSKLTLSPGQQIDLNAAASYRSLDLTGGDTCFTWTADEAIGTITPDGKFTAGQNTATGIIKVAAGGYAVTLSVSVAAPTRFSLLADFEGTAPFFTSDSTSLTLDTTAEQVKFGRQSLRADYTLTDGSSRLAASHILADTDQFLSLWIYGDGSGNTLTAYFKDEAGTELTQPLTTLNFTGWKNVSAAVPKTALSLEGLLLSGSKTSGTLWLDQVVLSNGNTWDTTPPAVSLAVSGTSVTATVSENVTCFLAQDQISLTLDGRDLPFTWDQTKGTLTATLSGLGNSLHRVTVTAADCCGNLGRDSVTLPGSSTSVPFADMKGHWALPYTVRLNELGIITGVSSGGTTNFYPNRSITRGDFALMTARWLGLNLKDYQSVNLPYADLSSIPSWNLDAVKALYAQGLMQGSKGSDGKLRANAKASITRAEAMTILGRTQAKGYGAASLSGFSDAGSVPAWSKSYVASLVDQGVVGGSKGQLRPGDPVSRAEVAKMLLTMW